MSKPGSRLWCFSLVVAGCGAAAEGPVGMDGPASHEPLTRDAAAADLPRGAGDGSDAAPEPDAGVIDAAPAADSDPNACAGDPDCDDGLACTIDRCIGQRCVTRPNGSCPWPAEPVEQAVNLTGIEGPLINDFHKDLSGAVWDPRAHRLWVCTNSREDSAIWVVEPDGAGGFRIGERGGQRGEWTGFGDLEALTLADLDEPERLYLMLEGINEIHEYDLSDFSQKVRVNAWQTGAWMPEGGSEGAEALTFVPDAFLAAQGFVDESGAPYLSRHGMGGLMFVGHQSNGVLYVFDLDRQGGTFDFVGSYRTGASETAGLEFDRSAGELYIWHDDAFDTLEVARLSSSEVDGQRVIDAARIYQGPGKMLFGSDNHEGIALMSTPECQGGRRGLFMTTDGGSFWSLLWYRQFPCP